MQQLYCDALDEAVYRHPSHRPKQLIMSEWTAKELREQGLANQRTVAGFPLVVTADCWPGEIR